MSWPKSRYCWHHTLRIAGPAALIGILTSAAIALVAGLWQLDAGAEQDLDAANLFARELPFVSANSHVVFGDNLVSLGPGGAVRLDAYFVGIPFQVAKTDDGRLRINGIIRDGKGRRVALIQESQLLVTPGLGLDVNSDDLGYEVVDDRGTPVLQVATNDARKTLVVTFDGYTRLPTGQVERVQCPYGGMCSLTPPSNSELLERMFEYPGYVHPGVRTAPPANNESR